MASSIALRLELSNRGSGSLANCGEGTKEIFLAPVFAGEVGSRIWGVLWGAKPGKRLAPAAGASFPRNCK